MKNSMLKMKLITLLCIVLNIAQIFSQNNSFLNPIIPGSYPDPSICKVGEEFYIVNSSFEYFPGLPIHKSSDLINWELIGYGLHREDQCNGLVNLIDVQSDGGIHAPTIRHYDDLFYIITTNVYYNEESKTTDFVNFIITAKNAKGPWSAPHILEGAPGIDPDIFFDDNGKVWYVGTHTPRSPNFPGEGEIWLQQINLTNWQLTGERTYLWRGACGGVWAEGPHLYKKDGRYYLMIAEGGTSFNHAVMIAVSDSIRGPYISNDRNPILTSRHLSYDNWVHSTGHADLIKLNDGRWFMVLLGIRGDQGRGSNMGRETHLIPVQWEREPFEWKDVRYEWPVAAPTTGKVERINPVPFQNTVQLRKTIFEDTFDKKSLDLAWNFRRVPSPNTYLINHKKRSLRLYAGPGIIKERGQTNLIGFRQIHSDFIYQVKMNFQSKNENTEAGITIIQKDNNYITLTVLKQESAYNILLKLAEPNSNIRILKKKMLPNYSNDIIFKVESKNHKYSYFYSLKGLNFILFEETESNHVLSKGYTGAYLGIYATGNGTISNGYADFDWVKYRGFP